MNYWFLYLVTTGEIFGVPYLGNTEEWENVPDGCDVFGPLEESTETKEAFLHPDFYLVQSGVLTPKPDIDDLRNAPMPPQSPTPEQEIAELKVKLQTAERIATETSTTQQELIELLIDMGVM